jgi:hypothetical protein
MWFRIGKGVNDLIGHNASITPIRILDLPETIKEEAWIHIFKVHYGISFNKEDVTSSETWRKNINKTIVI